MVSSRLGVALGLGWAPYRWPILDRLHANVDHHLEPTYKATLDPDKIYQFTPTRETIIQYSNTTTVATSSLQTENKIIDISRMGYEYDDGVILRLG
jgi:hypothetical protein